MSGIQWIDPEKITGFASSGGQGITNVGTWISELITNNQNLLLGAIFLYVVWNIGKNYTR